MKMKVKMMMKGKELLLNKLKHIKRDRILRVNAADGVENLEKNTGTGCSNRGIVEVVVPEVIDVAELMKDLEDDDSMKGNRHAHSYHDVKENIHPDSYFVGFEKEEDLAESEAKLRPDKSGGGMGGHRSKSPFAEITTSNFHCRDIITVTLFYPNLLESFEQAVNGHIRISKSERIPTCWDKEATVGVGNQLLAFEERCPPGGYDSVILYTTSLRGIRKTFEDCHSIRFILDVFRVKYYTRDVSMHAGYKEELREILGREKTAVVPPRLFIRGRDIGGVMEVMSLHECGKLKPLFKGIPLDEAQGQHSCCMGVGFIICSKCNGSHRIIANDQSSSKCPRCNENGLIVCPGCN